MVSFLPKLKLFGSNSVPRVEGVDVLLKTKEYFSLIGALSPLQSPSSRNWLIRVEVPSSLSLRALFCWGNEGASCIPPAKPLDHDELLAQAERKQFGPDI